MIECPKLKQYFGVDTFLVQRTSGWICLYTHNELETFPISCSRTKFSPSLLDKALKGAEKQRATPKDLPGEDWPWKIKTGGSWIRGWMHTQYCGTRTWNFSTPWPQKSSS